MLSVILIWFYMAVTAFLLGYGFLTGLTCLCPYQVQRWDSYLLCGLAVATVYAQFFSILAPVGLAANLLLVVICLIIAICFRKRLRADWQRRLQGVRKRNDRPAVGKKVSGKVIFLVLLFLLYAYGTSRGIIHYDTGLYHAQSIRWIEEYGIVKGLGNLHCRLAYNSASFALSALYSMAFLGGRSYHAVAGFLALLVAIVCSELADLVRRKYVKPSDFARVMGIYYLLMIFDEMVSPASDYFMVLTAFYLVIRWMDLLEAGEETIFPYAMLCVLGVFLLTVKLSAALIILLTLKPAAALLRGKKWRETALYLGLGILGAAPFLIRNVLLSGWLVYPFTGIDLFRVDWKIPEGIAAYDAKEIQVWGRGYSDVAKYDMPIRSWLPDWFWSLGGMDRLLVLAAVVSVLVFLLRLILTLWKVYQVRADKLLLEGVISICFLFWLFSSPLIRYGCVYVYLASAVIWGDAGTEFLHAGNRNNRQREAAYKGYLEKACILLIGVFLVYKAVMFGKEIAVAYVDDYWIVQKDYDNYETISYEIEGVTFYRPVTGDQTGYGSFPSSPGQARIGLRGDGIKDGFYYLK